MDKLDIDALYDESERAGRYGECAECGEEHVLCFCGVCFKYCHDDYQHADMTFLDDLDEPLRNLV
jgi:hypothetical protein